MKLIRDAANDFGHPWKLLSSCSADAETTKVMPVEGRGVVLKLHQGLPIFIDNVVVLETVAKIDDDTYECVHRHLMDVKMAEGNLPVVGQIYAGMVLTREVEENV